MMPQSKYRKNEENLGFDDVDETDSNYELDYITLQRDCYI